MSLPETNAAERAREHREPPAVHDHTTTAHAAPSRTTLMTIRRVLHAYREGWLLEGRLAAAARMAAEDARQHGLTAERMLIALKQEWTAMEEARRLPAIDAHDLLSALISLTIKAYFDPIGGGRRAGSPGDPDGLPERRTAA
jgi:hypothetical protein